MPAPVTPAQFEDAVPSNNADFCTRFSKWLNVPQLLFDLFEWMFTSTGAVSEEFKAEVATYSAPTGTVIFSLTLNVGTGWLQCLEANTKVKLSDGSYKTIREIVDGRLAVDVESYNFETGTIVPAKVVGWSKNKATKSEWYRLNFTCANKVMGSQKWHVDATGNHKFHTQRGWVAVDDLTPNDTIFRNQKTSTQVGDEAIIGMYLGDGSVSPSGRLTIAHSLKQSDYIRIVADKFGIPCLTSKHPNTFTKSGFADRITARISLKTFNPDLLPILKRSPDCIKRCLDRIGQIGLAYWYMDDGSLGKDNRGNSPAYRFQLHTEGYSLDTLEVIIDWFKRRFGVTAVPYFRKQCNPENCGGKFLAFSPRDSQVLFDSIAPYVLPSMRYKLPAQHADTADLTPCLEFVRSGIVPYSFTKTPASEHRDRDLRVRYKYDITIEGTHCFFANDILVHNCDGSEVSRTTYASLFGEIGTRYGAGDGSTTFTLPDFRGRSPMGAGQGSGLTNRDINTVSAGEERHTMTESELVAHTHEWNGPLSRTGEDGNGSNIVWKNTATEETESTGGGVPFNIVHPCFFGYCFVKI